MKIAVNTRLLINNKLEGIGWFIFETMNRITTQHPEHEFYFIFDRSYDKSFVFASNVKAIVAPPQARHPFLYFIWFELVLPKILKKIGADLFLSPDGYLSLRSNIKQIAVIHDLNFEHYPKDLPWLEKWYYRTFFPKYAQKATRIATVSEFSKSDIIKCYDIEADKIDVVYNGVNENFHPVDETVKQQIRLQFSEGCEYFICVGSIHPRKNIVNLLEAFELFKTTDKLKIKLLIVGQKKWWTEEMQNTINLMNFKSDVIFTGRVENRDLNNLIGSALALTYVSYHEGFGIPILEAFRCDTPVIASKITSMPEVAGDAALLINPFAPSTIVEAMKRISKDISLRAQLIEAGRERLKLYSWQKTADALWKSIEKALLKF